MAIKVAVIGHSVGGGSLQLASAVGAGVIEAAADAEVRVLRVADLVPDEKLVEDPRFGAAFAAKVAPTPVASIDDLRWADAIVVGGGARFGGPSAALRRFLEDAGPLWFSGELVNKVGGAFATSASPHGGVELATLSLLASLSHLGLILVTPGYVDPASHEGGSPYGPVARAGGRHGHEPTEADLGAARSLGRRIAAVTDKVRGLRDESQLAGASGWSRS
jgi:NAD(P)H dehydrogenase (quinone)